MVVPWQKTEHGFDVFIKLTPKARQTAIVGTIVDINNRCFLKISVTTVPENNKANQTLINLLSKILHVPKSGINIKLGVTGTRKTVAIYGVTEEKLKYLIVDDKGERP
jgi:uncharacterized protein YggU (UPF0235/DUF167 family)